MAIVDVAREEDIAPGGAVRVEAGGVPVALFNVDGELLAISDTCSHEDYSLAEGEVGDEYAVECALHGARFDLRTGAALCLPATLPVDTFPVWVEDGVVKIEVPGDIANAVA